MKLNFPALGRQAQNFTKENSPQILTAIGVTGALAGAVLTGKATVRAVKIVEIENAQRVQDRKPDLTKGETFKLLWKLYVPAAGVLTLTCVSVVCANRIGMKRTAAAAAALALTERGWDEYKAQVREQIGKREANKVEHGVAQKKTERAIAENGPLVIPTEGKVWCMDGYSGRPLMTTINAVEKAVNQVNRQIQSRFEGHATVSDFYDLIGLDSTSLSEEMGWHAGQVVELKWTTCANPDKTGPAMHVFDFNDDVGARPVLKPWANTFH